MGHDHHHHSTKNIKTAFFLNLTFTVFEIVGGIWTNSVAILADAIHDLGDSFSLGLSWYLDKKSKQKKDTKFSFGYQRFSLLSALINGIVLVIGSVFIFYEAIPRLITPEPSNAQGMIVFAIFGIIVNGYAAFTVGSGKTLNERMVSWHLFEDVLGWAAVLIVGIVLHFWDVPILDPILSVIILLFVLYNVIKNLRETLFVFLQRVPSSVDLKEVEEKISALEKVVSIHNTHIWSLDGDSHVLTIHLVVSKMNSVQELVELKREVKRILREIPINNATIEIEFDDEECYMEE